MKVLSKEEMPLLSRTKIEFEIEHITNKTPSEKEIIKKIADGEKIQDGLISIKHIYTNYGFGKSKIIAYLYKDKKTFDLFEKVKEKKEKTEAPAEKK